MFEYCNVKVTTISEEVTDVSVTWLDKTWLMGWLFSILYQAEIVLYKLHLAIRLTYGKIFSMFS